jgi:glutathione S-transferase
MHLYSAPLSCSLASHIALLETGADAGCTYVVLGTKKTLEGDDYLAIAPKGQVPALRLDDGEMLTEGPAVLQYIADRAPAAGLAPPAGSLARYRLQEWLNYLSTEVHKMVFATIFNPATPPESKAFARGVAPVKLDHISAKLGDRPYLMGDTFSVADAYLVTILGWCDPAGIDLARWPNLVAYRGRMMARPAVAKAVGEELEARARMAA